MRTPREVLLHKHQDIEPKLDALRERFVGRVTGVPADSPGRGGVGSIATESFRWRELIPLVRWHLAGLAAMWLLIAALRLGGAVADSPRTVQHRVNTPGTVILALKENRRQIQELGSAPIVSAPPNLPTAPPSRRSDLRIDWAYA